MPVVEKQTLIPFRSPKKLARCPQARPLVGRGADLARVIALIERGERLITVLGPPGIGKTSLATCVAERLSAKLPAWFCDLSNQHTDEDLCVQILSLLGASGPEVAELLAALGPALLVLDNFEQLTQASPRLLEWSLAAPELVLLVTSRERLAIDRECVVELAPLDVPDAAATEEEVRASEAVQLFQLRASDAGGSGADDLPAVAEVVRRLDGIPLAIELAAARTRLLSPADLAKRIRQGNDMLSLSKRSPARHKTLADAIAWSWKLLSDEEQRALACCSVFAGTFRVEAAERVLGAALDGCDALALIAALREKSLIFAACDERLGLYASIRDFSAQKLASEQPALRASARLEHARLYGELAARFTRSRLLLTPVAETGSHGGVQQDSDNLVAALSFVEQGAVAGRSTAAEHAALQAELLSALTFLGALRAEACDRPLAQALSREPPLPESLRAIVQLARQHALVAQGRFDEAFAAAEEVIERLEVAASMRAAALVRLGIQQRADGDALGALASHERAAGLLGEEASSLRGINIACLGRLMCDLRRTEAARRFNDEAAALCERIGEPWLAALGPANLAQLEQEQGQFEGAEALLGRALSRFRDAREPQYEGFYAAVCGGLYFEWGKIDQARHHYALGERAFETLSSAFSLVVLHGGRAALEARAGYSEAALHHLELARRNLARAPGALARIVVEAHGATVELALGLASGARVEAHRARLGELEAGATRDASIARNNLDTRFALRILARALTEQERVLRVKRGGFSFSLAGGEPVDLARRASLRRIVQALSEAHSERPGTSLGTEALFAQGWPGQRIQAESAATRVRVAIATLRKLGLRDVLLTRDDGYLFDPGAVVELDD